MNSVERAKVVDLNPPREGVTTIKLSNDGAFGYISQNLWKEIELKRRKAKWRGGQGILTPWGWTG